MMLNFGGSASQAGVPSEILKKEIWISNYNRPPKVASFRCDLNGPTVADSVQRAEMLELRGQLRALSDPLKEQLRIKYLLEKDVRQREQQEFQCSSLYQLEKILRKNMKVAGVDHKKFQIGGYERGTYEKFFRIEPGKTMSKAQFMVAITRCFGEGEVKPNAMSRLFDSFDLARLDEMDWRSFVYLLMIAMQPGLPCKNHIRYGYALYASSGSFDLDCKDPVSVETLKTMICTPVVIAQREEIKADFDVAWMKLTFDDVTAATAARKAGIDPDKALMTLPLFEKLISETDFAKYFRRSKQFTVKDSCTWLSYLEEFCYHPILVDMVKTLRRDDRNDVQVERFLRYATMRKKRQVYSGWKEEVRKICRTREIIVMASLRWRNDHCGKAFDKMKRYAILCVYANMVQKVARGYIGRRRKDFLLSIQHRVVSVQSATRQMQQRIKYNREVLRRRWAAITVQRIFRGYKGRRRVQTIVEASYDTGKRVLAMEKQRWEAYIHFKAACNMQLLVKRFLLRRRTMKRMHFNQQVERWEAEVEAREEQARVDKLVHKLELEKWFISRKVEYDKNTLDEERTESHRRKILAMRSRSIMAEQAAKQQYKLDALEKQEELRIELWLTNWEKKRNQRVAARVAECKRALQHPETPEDIYLQKQLRARIKKHVKVVLRRADKQHIPMEVPEARNLAELEIIETEAELERDRARQEERAEAESILKAEAEKAEAALEKERQTKERNKEWAATKIQSIYRVMVARKQLRHIAYGRYRKYFNIEKIQYYYEDRKTGHMQWNKPFSLGSYDVEADDGWVVMIDTDNDIYFYCPKTWEMIWDQPHLTVMCDICARDFAVCRMNIDLLKYCGSCFNKKVETMIVKENIMPVDIYFKPFKGNKQGAMNTAFTYIKDENYKHYLMANDPNIQAQILKAGKKIVLQQKKKKEKVITVQQCPRCSVKIAVWNCLSCDEIFCESCWHRTHARPPWTNHYTEVLPMPKNMDARAIATALGQDPDALQDSDDEAGDKRGKAKQKANAKDDDDDNEDEDDVDSDLSDSDYPGKPKPVKGKKKKGGKDDKKKKKKKKKKASGTGSESESGVEASDGGSESSPSKKTKKKKSKKKKKTTTGDSSNGETGDEASTLGNSDSSSRKKKSKKIPKKKKKIKGDGVSALSDSGLSDTGNSSTRSKSPSSKKKKMAKNKKKKTKKDASATDCSDADNRSTKSKASSQDGTDSQSPKKTPKKKKKKTDGSATDTSKSGSESPTKAKKKAKSQKSSKSPDNNDLNATATESVPSSPTGKSSKGSSSSTNPSPAKSDANDQVPVGTEPTKKKKKKKLMVSEATGSSGAPSTPAPTATPPLVSHASDGESVTSASTTKKKKKKTKEQES